MTVGHVEKEQDCGLKSKWGVWGTSGGLIRGTAWSAVCLKRATLAAKDRGKETREGQEVTGTHTRVSPIKGVRNGQMPDVL